MSEAIHFHTDLYRRDALKLAVEKYERQARIELADSGTHLVARVQALSDDGDLQALRDEFCNEAFSATARKLRDGNNGGARETAGVFANEPPWELIAPFKEGAELALGWVLESLSPVRSGAANLLLRHAKAGKARIAIRRNSGAPLGVAHTDQLDFMLMNGGGSTAQTDATLGRLLTAFASALRKHGKPLSEELLNALLPHSEMGAPSSRRNRADDDGPVTALTPTVDPGERTIFLELDEAGVSRLELYDAVLRLADRCYVFLTRPAPNRVGVQIKARGEASAQDLENLAREVADTLSRVAKRTTRNADTRAGLPPLRQRNLDVESLLVELEAADPTTVGIGFEPERGPGHEDLRVLNVRGTGACNSECLFCIEKFNPSHRAMPKADATRQLILDSANQYDMLFFASGEPTIHPKLFEYVELARSVGFTRFGMSSHFRTFADPRFTLKILQAGFEYFDIALHAADLATQLDVNPIDDGGNSLFEALKGLAVLYKLADALGVRVSITHKIVVSRLNVTRLLPIFHATFDRGVRHFILQPVRSMGLAPELQAKLAISEEGILPHLNDLLEKTQNLGAMVKPYGFSRQKLFAGGHIEIEQNRVKNIYGRARRANGGPSLPDLHEERPTDGRHWVEIKLTDEASFGFAADGKAPVLDDALGKGVDMMFGCRMGSCGMCSAKLLEGRVDQSGQIFLTEEQARQGFVLLCQARPLSDCVLKVCSDDEIDQL